MPGDLSPKDPPSHCHHVLLYKGLEEAFGAERPRDEVHKDPVRDHAFMLKKNEGSLWEPALGHVGSCEENRKEAEQT